MRDRIRDQEYFKLFLNNNRILIERLNCSSLKNTPAIQGALSVSYWQRCLAMYSAGYEIDAVIQEYKNCMSCFIISSENRVSLSTLTEYLSFAIITNDAITTSKIKSYCANSELCDPFLTYLFGDCDITKCLSSKIESVKQFVKNGSYSSGAQSQMFLEKKWYPLHKESGWYNSHSSKNPVYFGYWALEIAAILKREGYSYLNLKDCQFFPMDLYNY